MGVIISFLMGPLLKALAPLLFGVVFWQHVIINGLPILSDVPLVGGLFPQGLRQELQDERDARSADRTAALVQRTRDMAQAREDQRALDQTTRRADIAAAVAEDRENRPARIIRDEIPIYITEEIDDDFPIPVSLVRLHDAAASGSTPAATAAAAYPGFSNDGESHITMSGLATMFADNYRACRVNFAQTKESWQVWGQEVEEWAAGIIERFEEQESTSVIE